ncbi:MAG: glycosyltransferase family 2 protein [Lachnospiraceae bacterium]|nr:glycosyltransferase family 2 protein [Lachnospiraceae bacterium]
MTISVCMIVKNEEERLGRCLSSLAGIADEIVVVDTGSLDRTKEIASQYDAKIYDFAWVDEFAAARNYAFSLASCDYIYSADADEEIDGENRARFLDLKRRISEGEIDPDIVQFYYSGQLTQTSVYNYDRELRPKLFRRLRPFVWEGAIHEQVRLAPEVYDSGIEIAHKPHGQHADRDLKIFEQMIRREEQGDAPMPARLLKLYARELYIAGTPQQFDTAAGYFARRADEEDDGDALEAACLVVLRAARQANDTEKFFRYAMRLMNDGLKSSELCCEMGEHYRTAGDPAEAAVWFMQAAEDAAPSLDIRTGGAFACRGVANCLRALGDEQSAAEWEERADAAQNRTMQKS